MASATPEPPPTPWLAQGPDGLRLEVRAVPGARRDAVLGTHGNALRVAVRAVAEGGRANDALLELLAREFGVARRDVQLLFGRSGRDKVFSVKGIDRMSALARIGRLLGPASSPGGDDRR